MGRKKPTPTYRGLELEWLKHQLPSDWKPPRLGDLPDWPRGGRVALDIETCDPDLKKLGPGVRRDDSYITGVSFAIEGGPSAYLPIRHEGGDNLENPQHVFGYLEVQARQFDGEVVGANLQYDVDWLASEQVDFSEGPCKLRDIQVAAPLINELHMSYSLNNVAKRAGIGQKDEALLDAAAAHFNLQNPKGEMWKLPARYVGPYATWDAELPLLVLQQQYQEIEEQDLWDIFKLECDVQKVLIKMRRRGVLIDQDQLSKVEEFSLREEAEAVKEVKRLTGIDLGIDNCRKASHLAPILDKIGLPYSRTPKTQQPKIDKELLEAHLDDPVVKAIHWTRKVNMLRNTFVNSIRTHMVNGRIHCTFNQLRRTKESGDTAGAAYGRLSSENPNLQQQPARDSYAAMWRAIYLPEPGSVWGALDYSQQEPRWTVHYAELLELPKAFEAAEQYRNDPTTDNHQMMADMAGVTRKNAKAIFLGLIYGMGGAKLCRDLGLPTRWAVYYDGWEKEPAYFEKKWQARRHAVQTDGKWFEAAGEEGQALLNKFNYELPFLRQLAKACQDTAKNRGYILTGGGRRCRFPVGDDGEYDWVYKALNRLIQGTSADQTKRALVEADRAGHFIQLQVHDEIDGSFQGPGDAKDCAEIMTNCMPASVPFVVDVEIGPNWGEAEEIKEAA